jgi:hypothetical protein
LDTREAGIVLGQTPTAQEWPNTLELLVRREPLELLWIADPTPMSGLVRLSGHLDERSSPCAQRNPFCPLR